MAIIGSHSFLLFAVVEYASYNIGVFLCANCAGVHRSLGAHISRVKHLKLGNWEDSQVKRMEDVGNTVAQIKFEERVPVCYRKPTKETPQLVSINNLSQQTVIS